MGICGLSKTVGMAKRVRYNVVSHARGGLKVLEQRRKKVVWTVRRPFFVRKKALHMMKYGLCSTKEGSGDGTAEVEQVVGSTAEKAAAQTATGAAEEADAAGEGDKQAGAETVTQ